MLRGILTRPQQAEAGAFKKLTAPASLISCKVSGRFNTAQM